jgi:hypothetical protein
MRAMRMDNATGNRRASRAGGIDLAMQGNGFTGTVTADVLASIVKSRKSRWV